MIADHIVEIVVFALGSTTSVGWSLYFQARRRAHDAEALAKAVAAEIAEIRRVRREGAKKAAQNRKTNKEASHG